MSIILDKKCYDFYTPQELGGFTPLEVTQIVKIYWEKVLFNELENKEIDTETLLLRLSQLIFLSSEKSRKSYLLKSSSRKQKERDLKKEGVHKSQIPLIPMNSKAISIRNSSMLDFISFILYGSGSRITKELKFKSLNKGSIYIGKLFSITGLDIDSQTLNPYSQKFLTLLSQIDDPLRIDTYTQNLLNDRASLISQNIRKSIQSYSPAQVHGYYKGFMLTSSKKIIKI